MGDTFWNRPEWIELQKKTLKDYMGCVSCGFVPVVIHHNISESYNSFEKYLTLDGCVTLCFLHHKSWHNGLKKIHLHLCNECRLHWTSDTSGLCYRCRNEEKWHEKNISMEGNLKFYDIRKTLI